MTPIAYINVEKRTLEFAEPIKWHTPTVANLDRIPLFTKAALAQEKALQALHDENERLGLYKEVYAEQEPVAWRFKTGTWWNREVHWRYVLSLNGTEGLLGLEPLYTTPPQRPWVGLAAEDRLTAKYMQDAPDGIEAVIDYIEAKLKELNDHSI